MLHTRYGGAGARAKGRIFGKQCDKVDSYFRKGDFILRRIDMSIATYRTESELHR